MSAWGIEWWRVIFLDFETFPGAKEDSQKTQHRSRSEDEKCTFSMQSMWHTSGSEGPLGWKHVTHERLRCISLL